jgi:hypothetical protein
MWCDALQVGVVTRESLPAIMTALVQALQDASHVAFRACCAISALAMGFQGSEGGWLAAEVANYHTRHSFLWKTGTKLGKKRGRNAGQPFLAWHAF